MDDVGGAVPIVGDIVVAGNVGGSVEGSIDVRAVEEGVIVEGLIVVEADKSTDRLPDV